MESESFPLPDLLRDSLFYPTSGFDGSPFQCGGGHFSIFVYPCNG